MGGKPSPGIKLGICAVSMAVIPARSRSAMNWDLNYVSCSPYRVPIARLAAAQAALAVLEREESQHSGKKAIDKERTGNYRLNTNRKIGKTKTVTKTISTEKIHRPKRQSAKKPATKPTGLKNKTVAKSTPA